MRGLNRLVVSCLMGLAAACPAFFCGAALAEAPSFLGRAKCATDADCPQYDLCGDYVEECGPSLYEWGSDNCHCPDWDNGPGWEEMPCYCHKCDGPNSGPVETGIRLCYRPKVECQLDSDCTEPGLVCDKGKCRVTGLLVFCDTSQDCDWGWECIDHSWWRPGTCDNPENGLAENSGCCLDRVCAPKGWGHPVAGCSGGGGGATADVTSESGLAEADPTSTTPGSSSGGCGVGAATESTTWGLFVLALLALLPAVRRRPAAARAGLLIGGAALCMAPAARASCLWEPPQHLFVLPADGATDVPVDARIWVNAGIGSQVEVTVGGVALEAQRESLSWYSFPPPDPAPGAACEFTVRICFDEVPEPCTDYGPYSFTFGTGTAPAPAVPTLLGITGIPSEGNEEQPELPAELCKYQILSQDCFDQGQSLCERFDLAADPGTALYAVLGTKADKVSDDYLSTPDCGAQCMTLAPWLEVECGRRSTETCREVQAINLAGTRSEPVLLCGEAQITLDDGSSWHSDCVAQEDAPAAADQDVAAPATPDGNGGGGSGCSATTHGPASGPLALLAALSLAFALVRQRRLVAVVLLALGLIACDAGNDVADGTGGTDAVADATGTEDAATADSVDGTGTEDAAAAETVAGDPEFAAYCQGIVDAFRALYENLELPDNLAQEKPPPHKTGEEFDPNEFFTVLDRLHTEEGWTLDFTYLYAWDMGGETTLVARKTDSPLCQSDPEHPCVTESFLKHVLVDGSREGWFQLQVLRLMGQEFYCDWHGCSGMIILPSHEGLVAWMEGQMKHFAPGEDNGFDEEAIAALAVDPVVEVHDDWVHVDFVWFARGSGIVRSVTDISTAPPYSTVPGGEHTSETLFECTWCGVP